MKDKSHCILIKGIIHQGDDCKNARSSKIHMQTLITEKRKRQWNKQETGTPKLHFQQWLEHLDRRSRKREPINQVTDIYRTLCPSGAENTLFSNTHWTFSKTDHVRQQIILNKFKQTEIYNVFSLTTMKWN